MSVNVRFYSCEGVKALPVSSYAGQLSVNGTFAVKHPYLYGEVLSANTGAAVSTTAATSAPNTNEHIKVALVQIAPGSRVHFEVTPFGLTPRVATTNSPILQGDNVLPWGPGWTLSVLEAAVDA